jgi:homogentisate 1,2-dioxygenase
MARSWSPVRAAEGVRSRQANADMSGGTHDREVSEAAFFGPAACVGSWKAGA